MVSRRLRRALRYTRRTDASDMQRFAACDDSDKLDEIPRRARRDAKHRDWMVNT